MLSELKIVTAIGKTVYCRQLVKTFEDMGFDLFKTENDPILIEIEILKCDPDAVIMNIDNMDFEGINNLVKHISTLDKIPYIFALYSYDSSVTEEVSKIDSVMCIEMPANFTDLCREIKTVHKNTIITMPMLQAEIKEKIIEIFSLFNITTRLFGYTYLRDAIFMATFTNKFRINFSKEVYPVIAEEYNTSVACVERAIRVAINKSWEKTSVYIKNQFFKSEDLRNHIKPTNNEFIMTMANFIHEEYQHFFDKVYLQNKDINS